LLFAMLDIGLKTRDRQLAANVEIEADRTKRFDKPGFTEGCRRLLLARAMSARARRTPINSNRGVKVAANIPPGS